jgi:hypothetical protein
MDLLAFHILRGDYMVKAEDEDARRVGVREHCGVARVLLIETGQMIQMRLGAGVDAVIADRGG